MVDVNDIKPLKPIWPIRPVDPSSRKDGERRRTPAEKPNSKEDEDDDGSKIDEYV